MTLPSPAQRREQADALAGEKHWHEITIATGQPFELVAFVPETPVVAERLTVYIEGDGLAWITRDTASANPTPRDPVALRLALAQAEGAAAYLGRPCQYVAAAPSECPNRYWTSHRFAPEVITSVDRAINVLKTRFGASRLTLVGYSGGGAVAALIAARRSDVERLITVAGNVDHRAWTSYHGLQPLSGSLNPADDLASLSDIPQWHFAGGRDTTVPPALIQAYANRFPPDQRPHVRVEPEFGHRCCWAEQWPRLLRDSGIR